MEFTAYTEWFVGVGRAELSVSLSTQKAKGKYPGFHIWFEVALFIFSFSLGVFFPAKKRDE